MAQLQRLWWSRSGRYFKKVAVFPSLRKSCCGLQINVVSKLRQETVISQTYLQAVHKLRSKLVPSIFNKVEILVPSKQFGEFCKLIAFEKAMDFVDKKIELERENCLWKTSKAKPGNTRRNGNQTQKSKGALWVRSLRCMVAAQHDFGRMPFQTS